MRKLLILTLAVLILSGCVNGVREAPLSPPLAGQIAAAPVTAAPEQPTTITITAIGDIMAHMRQQMAAHDRISDKYNFSNSFKDLKPVFNGSDLTIANLETVFAGKNIGYSGYPLFNAPDALATDIKNAGIDWVSTANNHALDKGEAGLRRTIEVLNQAGLVHEGTYLSQAEQAKDSIYDVKGIKIAFLSYTTTLNGMNVPKGKEYLVNRMDMDQIAGKVRSAKAAGAELVVLSLHAGVEYQRQPTKDQQDLAEKLVKAGVDIILGSHPHVLEPIKKISTTSGGVTREGVVVYSLGNYVSNQSDRYTDSSIVLSLKIEKKGSGIEVEEIRFIPIMVLRSDKSGKDIYRVIPVQKALKDYEQKQDPEISPAVYAKLKEVWQEITGLLTNQGQEILPQDN